MSTRSAFGIGYHLWLRARPQLLGSAAYVAALAVAVHLVPSPAARFVAAGGSSPLAMVAAALIGIFSFGADASSPESGFPRHMMTLPLTARGLVLPPMVFGCACLALFWVALARLVLAPAGWAVPAAWPAALLAATLAWLQATSWMPFRFPFVRIAACVASLVAVIAFAVTALALGVSEPILVMALLGVAALAAPAAVVGVARARRGDGTGSRSVPRATARAAALRRSAGRRPFRSAGAALVWLELRRNCTLFLVLILPMALASVLPLLQAGTSGALEFGGILVDVWVFELAAVVATPLFLAGLAGAGLAKPDAWSARLTLPPFLAARPVGESALVAAKLKAAAVAVAATWAVPLTVLTFAMLVPHPHARRGTAAAALPHFAVTLLEGRAAPRLLAAACGFSALALVTWVNVIKAFAWTFYGRKWMANGVPTAVISLITASALLGGWAWAHPGSRASMLAGLGVATGGVVAAKVTVAGLLYRGLRRGRIVTDRQLVSWAVAWAAVTGMLFVIILWLLPPARPSALKLAAGLALLLPFNRLVAMPLALYHNRHR